MKKYKHISKFVSLVVTIAMVMSCGGYLFADEVEEPEVQDEVVSEESEGASSEDELVYDNITSEPAFIDDEPADALSPVANLNWVAGSSATVVWDGVEGANYYSVTVCV